MEGNGINTLHSIKPRAGIKDRGSMDYGLSLSSGTKSLTLWPKDKCCISNRNKCYITITSMTILLVMRCSDVIIIVITTTNIIAHRKLSINNLH